MTQWLTLCPLINAAWVRFPALAFKMVCGNHVKELGFLRAVRYLPTARPQKRLDLRHREIFQIGK